MMDGRLSHPPDAHHSAPETHHSQEQLGPAPHGAEEHPHGADFERQYEERAAQPPEQQQQQQQPQQPPQQQPPLPPQQLQLPSQPPLPLQPQPQPALQPLLQQQLQHLQPPPQQPLPPPQQTPPPQPPPPPSLQLQLQQQLLPDAEQQGEGGGGKDGEDRRASFREEWTEEATDAVLDVWAGKHLALNRGKLKRTEWDEVAEHVNRRLGLAGRRNSKTGLQCKNKIDSIKKKYKIVRNQRVAGSLKRDWKLFDKVDELLGPWPHGGRMEESDDDEEDESYPSSAVRPTYHATPIKQSLTPLQPEAPPAYERLPALARQMAVPSPLHTTSAGAGAAPPAAAAAAAGAPGHKKKRKAEANPLTELTRAIREFGAVYRDVELAKQEKLLDLEHRRMAITKDMEAQRLNVQLEIYKLLTAKQEIPPPLFDQE